jgi:hypothetical protein
LLLPRVTFRDGDLIGVLRYMQQKAEQQSRGAIKVSFVLDLPADFKPRYELSLDLTSVPFAEALRYLGEEAGLQFSQSGNAIFVRREGPAPTPPPLTDADSPKAVPASTPKPSRTARGLPDAQLKPSGVTGALGKPASTATGSNNAYRNMNGDFQPDKSGTVPRRELNGFPAKWKALDLNCARPAVCPGGECGCNVCSCLMHH